MRLQSQGTTPPCQRSVLFKDTPPTPPPRVARGRFNFVWEKSPHRWFHHFHPLLHFRLPVFSLHPPRPRQPTRIHPEALKPAQRHLRLDPPLCLRNLLIRPVVLPTIGISKLTYYGLFVLDQPIQKWQGGLIESRRVGRLQELLNHLTRDGRAIASLPEVAPASRPDESKTSFRPVPSGTGPVELDLPSLPRQAVATGPLQSLGGKARKSLCTQEVALRPHHILPPKKHLLL